ncbi:glycosyltransferase [Skermanella stibiiresistens]|uniref:glycosyltransferase n=1 Tax=Skermanella stibiiresistens TaxID=913326 RepID=UPI0004B7A1C7|nr:glycosyltransferase [Skermanella stibiiresistens]
MNALSQLPVLSLDACPICNSKKLDYQFTHEGSAIVGCTDCGFVMRNPQPTDLELEAIYSSSYFLGADRESNFEEKGFQIEVDRLKRKTAALYLDEVESYLGLDAQQRGNMSLLEIGCGLGNFLIEAQSRGYQITGVEVSESAVATANDKLGSPAVHQGFIETVDLPAESFDICIMADVIEHTRDPGAFLSHVRRLLKPGGVIFVAVPSLDSWSAKAMKERWVEFKLEHLFYFDRRSIESLLFKSGFESIALSGGRKILSPEYIIQHFERFPVPVITPAGRFLRRLLPKSLCSTHIGIVASGVNVMARRGDTVPPVRRRQKLSVVMPVFNERGTFTTVMERLLAKTIEGLDMEVVVVESNSTDGTREQVQSFASHPKVKVVFEEKPRGKGHAVRTGLRHATGDFILIQDADLEYDIDDYDMLLEPLRSYRSAFVLGIRHGKGGHVWKIRQFSDQVALGNVMNLGHLFFTTLFNVVYGQKLRDPFTMYKVFRRECISGIEFECNRFDFDWELMAKLVRSGYTPLEIPVNYHSRSFTEGKKVTFFRDPLTWFRACFKYRFVSLKKGWAPASSATRSSVASASASATKGA